jgi:carbon storage regulator
MLVLSRKQHDVILIGDEVRITVVRIDRNQVRLGIEAPQHISVLREELQLDADDRAAREAWNNSDSTERPPVPGGTQHS